MKRVITVFILLFTMTLSTLTFAESNISEWAEPHFEFLERYGISIDEGKNGTYKETIKRLQFAEVMYSAYKEYTGKEVDINGLTESYGLSPFDDTRAEAPKALYVLGVISGDDNNNFNPKNNITRQEAAKMLYNFCLVMKEGAVFDDATDVKDYVDDEKIASWAKGAVRVLSGIGIMNGKEGNKFCPNDNLTIEEAVVLISRAMQDGEEQVYQPETIIGETNYGEPVLEEGKTETISFHDLPNAKEYEVKIIEYRNTIHSDEMGAKDPVIYIVNEKEFTFNTKPVRRYEITVTAGNKTKNFEIKTSQLRPWSENLAEIEAYGLPTTKEEADALMEEVTVDVWKISGGKKVASKATFTVHKAIAEKVRCIFKEIFEGEEKFPINSIGGYAWRGGKSEHNYGTALDINPNENYCIYTSGEIVGSFYKPYENPYSIKPYGEVVEIFEKYGFNWGADTWRGNRDYMHFSYCGT